MKSKLLGMAALLGTTALIAGCEATDPGSPSGNLPPTTRVVVAPMASDTTFVQRLDSVLVDTVWVDTLITTDTLIWNHHQDHFVSPSIMFHVQWFGNDPDGRVTGYWVQVDNGPEVWTVHTDSLMSFQARTTDPDNAGRLKEDHVLIVTAVDNEGLRDPTPASHSIVSVNWAPAISHINSTFRDSSDVGPGIAFSVSWNDLNPARSNDKETGVLVRLTIDNLFTTEWDSRPGFQFCKSDDAAIRASVVQETYQIVDISKLSAGMHELVIELQDLGGAASDPETLHVNVVADTHPHMTKATSKYGSVDTYPDGSVYFDPGTLSAFTLAGTAAAYFGTVQSYRYQWRYHEEFPGDTTWGAWGAWSAWGGNGFSEENLDPGNYELNVQCRDFAGAHSDTLVYPLAILVPYLDELRILVVDETRDGNGGPGSPNDVQCDDFYADILSGMTGWKISTLDYVSVEAVATKPDYVSALNVYNKRIVIWHTDDRSDFKIGSNIRILSEYLDHGGRLIISGQNVLQGFNVIAADSSFSSGFIYDYLRLAGGRKSIARDFAGMEPVDGFGYPAVRFDTTGAKAPDNWAGIEQTWVLTPRFRSDNIGTFVSASNDTAFSGYGNCVLNNSTVNPWRTLTLGFPLYFMRNDDARAFIEKAIADLNQ